MQNDTGALDRFRVRGDSGDRRWAVRYLDGSRDVTAAVTPGNYRTGVRRPGGTTVLWVVVRPTHRAERGDRNVLDVTSSAVGPGHARDTVVAITTRR